MGSFSGQVDFDPGAGTKTLGANGATDIYFLKLDTNGDLLWAKTLGGAAHEQATSVAVNAAGEVYVGGFFTGEMDFDSGTGVTALLAGGLTEGFVAKFTGDGELVWAKAQVPAAGHRMAITRSLGLDSAGNVYAVVTSLPLTATFATALGNTGLVVQIGMETSLSKLDAQGNVTWTQRWNGVVGGVLGSSVAVGSQGELTLVGSFRGAVDFNHGVGVRLLNSAGESDGFILRLDRDGGHTWSQGLGGTGLDEIHALALDEQGGVYVGGTFSGAVDLDPGTGVKSHVAAEIGEESFVLKLTTAGAYGGSYDCERSDICGASRWRRHLCSRGPIDGCWSSSGLGYRREVVPGSGTEGLGGRAGADGEGQQS